MAGYRRCQRYDAGSDDVEQVRDGKVCNQPVIDRSQQSIARENRQREAVERQRQSSDDSDHHRHHVFINGS